MPQRQCMNCNVGHSSNDTNFPVYLDERAIQELRIKEGLPFLVEKSEHAEPTLFISPSSLSGDPYRYSKTLASPSRKSSTSHSIPPHVTASTQILAAAPTADVPHSAAPGANTRLCQSPDCGHLRGSSR
jgi:hypothetical protein